MRLLLLAVIAFAMPSMGFDSSKPLLSLDCNGQMEMQIVSVSDFSADLREILRFFSVFSQRAMKRAKCMCPSTPDSVLRSRYSFFDTMMKQFSSHGEPEMDACLDDAETPTMDWSKLYIIPPFTFDMPESCQWEATGKCAVEAVLTENLHLQIAAETCYNGMPAFSIHCTGPACDVHDLCNDDSDCSSGTCSSLLGMTDLLQYLDPFKSFTEFTETNLFQKFTEKWTGTSYTGACALHKDVLDEMVAVIAEVGPKKEQACGHSPKSVKNIDLRSWDGILFDGHNAFFDLNAGRYGRTRELDGDDATNTFAFTCKDELLLPGFGMKIRGLNKLVQALAAVDKGTWTFDPSKYAASMEFLQPSFWLALTTSFPGAKQWAPSPNYARCLFDASATGCPETILFNDFKDVLQAYFVEKVDVAETLQWSHWNQFKKAAVTLLGKSVKMFDMSLWIEQCSDYPDAIPSFAVRTLSEELTGAVQLCKEQSDCAADQLCLTQPVPDYMGLLMWSGCKEEIVSAFTNGTVSAGLQKATEKQCSAPDKLYEDFMFLCRGNGDSAAELTSGSHGICVTNDIVNLQTVASSSSYFDIFKYVANEATSPLDKLNAEEFSES